MMRLRPSFTPADGNLTIATRQGGSTTRYFAVPAFSAANRFAKAWRDRSA